MREFKDKVAVITGGAGGIGLSLAKYAAGEGMRIVLSDVDDAALEQARKSLSASGASVLTVRADVSKLNDVEVLAQKAIDTYGGVHLLFNNAGVSVFNTVWEASLADWQWVLGVDLWGVIHGVKVFTPIMLAQDTECHIVNTSSVMGLMPNAGQGIYCVAKYGVVALSETMYQELALREAKVKVSVLCPSFVSTGILSAERNRPTEYGGGSSLGSQGAATTTWADLTAAGFNVIEPDDVAKAVFAAIRDDLFYILTNPEITPLIGNRMEDILKGRNPQVMGAATR